MLMLLTTVGLRHVQFWKPMGRPGGHKPSSVNDRNSPAGGALQKSSKRHRCALLLPVPATQAAQRIARLRSIALTSGVLRQKHCATHAECFAVAVPYRVVVRRSKRATDGPRRIGFDRPLCELRECAVVVHHGVDKSQRQAVKVAQNNSAHQRRCIAVSVVHCASDGALRRCARAAPTRK